MGIPKMNPEAKAEWLRLLRSGEYPQGHGTLCRLLDGNVEFCCAGVLCEVAKKAGIVRSEEIGTRTRYHDASNLGDHSTVLLPRRVRDWANLDSMYINVPMRPEYSERLSAHYKDAVVVGLVELNDNGFTFAEIADIIEREL